MATLAILTADVLLSVLKGLTLDLRLPPDERALLQSASMPTEQLVSGIRADILAGEDPLGEAFSIIRSADERRGQGQTFTPQQIVRDMVARARTDADAGGEFVRIVDAGTGSGRFLREAARTFPKAKLIGIESEPLCALIARATFHVLGILERVKIIVGDFRAADLPKVKGRTLYIGNPPYVRHHDIDERWKDWYSQTAIKLGATSASKLAGLHLHFFVRVGEVASLGDLGLFITAAEWLDTGYGAALRSMLRGSLGARRVLIIDPRSEAFPGTMTTAVVTEFAPGQRGASISFAQLASVASLSRASLKKIDINSDQLINDRWSSFGGRRASRSATSKASGRIGDLFRVSRGQVTGNNSVFVEGPGTPPLPDRYLIPCVTGAHELFEAADKHGYRLINNATLSRVVCLPDKLSLLSCRERAQIDAFLAWAQERGAHAGYTAKARKCWWQVVLKDPPPIIVTYMARRAPVFVRNMVGANILNIAHGVRPLEQMTEAELDEACRLMNKAIENQTGRVYAGGLTKFEPRDVEAVAIDWRSLGLSLACPQLEFGSGD